MDFDLKRVKVNRQIRTPDCEWYTLTTDEKEDARRLVTDSTGKKGGEDGLLDI